MIGLTRVSRRDYESLLMDGKRPVDEIMERYGAGWMFRLQGILCAMAVRQCALDADGEGYSHDTAEELYDLVDMFDYGSIFEDNGMERCKPGPMTLKAMLYSMCQAETGDYGGDFRWSRRLSSGYPSERTAPSHWTSTRAMWYYRDTMEFQIHGRFHNLRVCANGRMST